MSLSGTSLNASLPIHSLIFASERSDLADSLKQHVLTDLRLEQEHSKKGSLHHLLFLVAPDLRSTAHLIGHLHYSGNLILEDVKELASEMITFSRTVPLPFWLAHDGCNTFGESIANEIESLKPQEPTIRAPLDPETRLGLLLLISEIEEVSTSAKVGWFIDESSASDLPPAINYTANSLLKRRK